MLTRRASSFSSLPVGTSGAIFGSAWGYRPIPANTSNLASLTFTASLHSLGAVTTAADWQTAGPTEPRDLFLADINWVGPPPPPPCDPDLDGDRLVDGRDLGILFSRWYATGETAGDADLNEDGYVDGQDMTLMFLNWGACPETPEG